MYLSVMHFKWTNVVCLSMGMLLSLMMDVVIISAKLVCHLYFVCKLNNTNGSSAWLLIEGCGHVYCLLLGF
jgi:hypothetical protein